MPELIIKAQAEAIKRFYDDKAFAVKAYIAYDKQDPADIGRIYDMIAKANAAGTRSVCPGRGDQIRHGSGGLADSNSIEGFRSSQGRR